MTLNQPTNMNDNLYEIDYTPKGTTERKTVYVYARNSLDAHNFMIYNKIWGKQHSIRLHNGYSLLKNR